MINVYWLLLLPIAAASGWAAASGRQLFGHQKHRQHFLPKDYLMGLNFLLNEEPDKAIDLFIKMLEVDSETVETHLALGNLFRRRGEVDRATRIHQNLIARPNLKMEYRMQALLALAEDYLSAGVFDRAEKLFLELLEKNRFVEKSSRHLIEIYEQEREWGKAISIALRFKNKMIVPIAHYYCELAENVRKEKKGFDRAIKLLKKALSFDKQSVRASLMLAEIAIEQKKYKAALKLLKSIRGQDPDYFSEAVVPLVDLFQALGQEQEMVEYFKGLLKEYPRMPIALILSEKVREWRGDKFAAKFVADYVRRHPSIAGLHRLVQLNMPMADEKAKRDLAMLHHLTEQLASDQALYRCAHCGLEINTLHWLCPSCRRWSTIKPTDMISVSSDVEKA